MDKIKRLMNTLYISSPDRYLALEGENVVVLQDKTELGRIPLHTLNSIITFGYTGASPALMRACAERGVSLSFMSSHGRFIARIVGEVHGNVVLRREQYRVADDEARSILIARNMITGKLYNSKWVLERALRDYPMRVDTELIKRKCAFLDRSIAAARCCDSMDSLRGIEGEGAGAYFAVLNELILQQKEDFEFTVRSRRPPLDNFNALLSFVYSLTAGMCSSALEAVGLDPYVGFMHTDRPGRVSLALDLMEELRSVLCDRFVVGLINKKMINSSGFIKRENGAVIMEDETRSAVLKAWQSKKQETLIHPFIGEKVEWGMVAYVQSMLLARYIRGDMDAYPPFMWK